MKIITVLTVLAESMTVVTVYSLLHLLLILKIHAFCVADKPSVFKRKRK